MFDYKTISLFDQPLFTWMSTSTPAQGEVEINSEACLAYIVEGQDQFLIKEENIKATKGQFIASLCGYTMSHMLSNYREQEGFMSTVVVHFHKDILKRIYEGEKPPAWEELKRPVSKYVVQQAANELITQYFVGITHLFKNQEALSEEILVLKLKEIILLLLQTKNADHLIQMIRSLFST
ncbi:MAG: hypothetical protein AAFY41_14410, partial [Bacteroidota bacterium]